MRSEDYAVYYTDDDNPDDIKIADTLSEFLLRSELEYKAHQAKNETTYG